MYQSYIWCSLGISCWYMGTYIFPQMSVWGGGGHDRIAGGFTTTYAIGAITTDVVRCEKVCQ